MGSDGAEAADEGQRGKKIGQNRSGCRRFRGVSKWWVSCPQFTVQVNTDEKGRIVYAAPVVREFIGQPLDNLIRWQGCEVVQLEERIEW